MNLRCFLTFDLLVCCIIYAEAAGTRYPKTNSATEIVDKVYFIILKSKDEYGKMSLVV